MTSNLVNSITEGLSYVQKHYLPNSRVLHSINGDRGPFCYILSHCDSQYYLTFNRKWFYGFGLWFPHIQPRPNVSQSFKMSMLTKAAFMNATIMTIMPDGYAYIVNAQEALNYVDENEARHIPPNESVPDGYIPGRMLVRVHDAIIC